MSARRAEPDVDLVGYLLNALDPEARQAVEGYLRDSPDAPARLARARKLVEPLAADRNGTEVPAGLADRALARIASRNGHALPCAPRTLVPRSGGADRRGWRRRDVLVAASLILVALGVGLPWLARMRLATAARVDCQNNLRAFHRALTVYSQQHEGNLPKVEEQPPRNVASVFVPVLYEAGVLGQDVSVTCPTQKRKAPPCAASDAQGNPQAELQVLLGSPGWYAYSLGYRDADGQLHDLRRDPAEASNDSMPVLSDGPLVTADRGSEERRNSAFHGGGQNVLYLGGNVRYCTQPTCGVNGDNIFVNQVRVVAAGLNAWDTVLGNAGDQP